MAQDQQEQRSAWKAENTTHGKRTCGCSMRTHRVLGWKLLPLLCSEIVVTMILSGLRDFRKNILQLNSSKTTNIWRSCWCKMCLELWLIQRNTSAKAPRGNLTVCWRKLGCQYHVIVRVEGTDFFQGAGFFGQTVDKFAAVCIKPQQADPKAMWGWNHPAIRTETKFFDVTPAHIGFFNAMSQSQGTTRRDGTHRGSFLEFIDTSPLKGEAEKGTLKEK